MVGRSAARAATLVAGSALLLLLAGFVLWRIARILMWSAFVALAVVLAYATYELYAGWTAAAETGTATAEAGDVDRTEGARAVRSPRRSRAGELTDEEFEAEIDRLLEDDPETDSDRDRDLEC